MGSVVPTPTIGDIAPLTALERIGPKGYLRYVFPFELPENYDMAQVAETIQAGYNAARARIAILDCEGVPDPDSKQAGVLRLQRIPTEERDNADVAGITIKDLRGEGAFPLSYADLKAKHFPVSAFEGDVVMRRPVWVQPGERLPVSLAQANFVPGGMLLTWCILHMFGDGNTFYTWTRIWAEECVRHQGIEIPEKNLVKIDPAMLADRATVSKPSGRNKGRIEDHSEYTLLPFTPPGAPPKMQSKSHRGQVFYFTPEKLAALKQEANPANAKQPSSDSPSWISTNDALSALLWRTVMNVQWSSALKEGTLEGDNQDPVSVFNIAIDGRLRTDPPVHPHTLGCFLEYVAVSAPIRKMLSENEDGIGIADLAIMIRKALLKADNQFTDDVVALVDTLEDVDRLVATAFLDVPGYNCVQTSWVNFELYGLEWGPQLGHKVQSVRAPDVGVINGLQVVLPTLPDGSMEILVGVEDKSLYKLLHDPLWMKFAEAR